MVGAQDLTEKNPERDQRRINAVDPDDANRGKSLRHEILRKQVAEWQIVILGILTPKELHLLTNSLWIRMTHLGASLPLMCLSQQPSAQERPFLPMSLSVKDLLQN
jgi:hypothetical protein